MSPGLLRRALRETLHTRRLSQSENRRALGTHARWPQDYYRSVDRPMIHWLRLTIRMEWT